MRAKKTLVLGANGQLGRALRKAYDADPAGADIEFASRAEFDLADPAAYASRNWSQYGAIVNAAAYTAVDKAETPEGRRDAWAANVTAVAALARIAVEHRITLVHVSSDYVFDGTKDSPYTEDDAVCPLGVYGQTKAAGDAVVSVVPRHYIVRTSWVIGDGNNFVRTMANLAARGIKPSVVDDQVGRLSFTEDIAAGIRHLLESGAPFGTYNLTNDGEPRSWADVARTVYEHAGRPAADVSSVSTADYFADKPEAAPRPLTSILALDKLRSTGFSAAGQDERLGLMAATPAGQQ